MIDPRREDPIARAILPQGAVWIPNLGSSPTDPLAPSRKTEISFSTRTDALMQQVSQRLLNRHHAQTNARAKTPCPTTRFQGCRFRTVIEPRMWTFLRPTSMIHGPSSGNGDSIMVHEHAPGHLHTAPEAIEHGRDVRTSSGACSSPVIPSFEHGTPRARNNRMERCVSVRRSLTRPLTVMHGAIGFSSSWCCEPLRCCLDDGREKHHKAKAKNDQDVSLNSQSQQLNRFSSHPSLSLFSS